MLPAAAVRERGPQVLLADGMRAETGPHVAEAQQVQPTAGTGRRPPGRPRSRAARRRRRCGTARSRAPSRTPARDNPGRARPRPRTRRPARALRPSRVPGPPPSRPRRRPARSAPERRGGGRCRRCRSRRRGPAPANPPSSARRTIAGCGPPVSQGAGPSSYDASHGRPACRSWLVAGRPPSGRPSCLLGHLRSLRPVTSSHRPPTPREPGGAGPARVVASPRDGLRCPRRPRPRLPGHGRPDRGDRGGSGRRRRPAPTGACGTSSPTWSA